MSKNPLHLFVSVPICGFRVAQAREYWETYPCPPPSTVYGMLLSLIGESDRLRCKGAEIALCLLAPHPDVSVVLRTLWRVKDKKKPPGTENNVTPDFQELLSHVRLSVWIREGKEDNSPSLVERLQQAIQSPHIINRFGGLSLGESTHLVDEVREWRPSDPKSGYLLVQNNAGDLSLPIWPNHVGSKGTRWGQFSLRESLDGKILHAQPDDDAWIPIIQDDK